MHARSLKDAGSSRSPAADAAVVARSGPLEASSFRTAIDEGRLLDPFRPVGLSEVTDSAMFVRSIAALVDSHRWRPELVAADQRRTPR